MNICQNVELNSINNSNMIGRSLAILLVVGIIIYYGLVITGANPLWQYSIIFINCPAKSIISIFFSVTNTNQVSIDFSQWAL